VNATPRSEVSLVLRSSRDFAAACRSKASGQKDCALATNRRR